MKKMSTLCLSALFLAGTVAAQEAQDTVYYQIPNSDFENWAADNEPGNGWNSFASAVGSMSWAASMSPAPLKVAGYDSDTAVQLSSVSVLGIANANGNLTTGAINMGSMTPDAPENYNFSDLDNAGHNLPFAGMPDSVSCYAKFISGGSENGRGQFILHDQYEYRDPELTEDAAHKIGQGTILIPATADWTYFSAPMTYTGNTAGEGGQYLLASFTTNPVPGGSANDTLTVDKVRFIYNSCLESVTIGGEALAGFDKNTYSYVLRGDVPAADAVAAVADGRAATVETTVEGNTVTIVVRGGDYAVNQENTHTYTIVYDTTVTAYYQLSNADFENWAADNEPGNGWNSFASAVGSMSWAASMSPAPLKVAGYDSDTAVQLSSVSVLGIANANGNLTTGAINMGSMTPDAPENYNFSDLDNPGHYLPFVGVPDSVSCYAKFISGGSENGRGQFILHDQYEYRDPELAEDAAHKIASGAILVPPTAEWTYFSAPMDYTGNTAGEGGQYLLASFTTNPVPGGSANDTLTVDKVRFIYNSRLESLSIGGEALAGFDKNTYSYVLRGDVPAADAVAAVADGRGATVETTLEGNTLTVVVRGNDYETNAENTHTYTVVFDNTGASYYQLPNADFEDWAADNEPGNGWNSFASAVGSMSWAASMSPAPLKVAGYDSDTAVQLSSVSVLGIANANGNLTTGAINMGSMTPDAPENYNFSDLDNPGHYLPFVGVPDSVACYAKFISGGSENGRGQFILHDRYEYRDPELEDDAAHKIASGAILIPATADWTYFSAPMEYTGNEAADGEQFLLASFTTNPVPGGSAGDTLTVDQVRFIYNSRLESLTVSGVSLEGFDKNVYEYELDGEVPSESDIVAVADGRGAEVSVSVADNVATITVLGNDYAENPENTHTYTLTYSNADGIGDHAASGIRVTAVEGGLLVEGAAGCTVSVYTVQGTLAAQQDARGETLTIGGLVPHTVYIVKAGTYVTRVLTK